MLDIKSAIESTIQAIKDGKGGATVNLSDRPLGRFVIGGLGTVADTVAAMTDHAADMSEKMARMASGDVQTVGSWLDTTDGTVYLDYGSTTDDMAQALDIARKRGEIAIWDSVANREIRL